MGAETVRPYERRLSGVFRIREVRQLLPRSASIFILVTLLLAPSVLGVAALLGAGEDAGGGAEKSAILATGTPPRFVVFPRDPQPATYGIQVNITAMVQDADNNIINVTWDWGDGNITLTQTLPALVSKIIKANHTYRPPIEQGRGDYIQNMILMIYLDDGNGNNVSDPTTVQVLMPPNGWPTRPGLYLNGTSSTKLDPAELVYVNANSSDPEGEPLTWTCFFTNGTGVIYRVVVLNTPRTAPDEDVWVNISHSFGTEGLHRIDIYVSDALVPYQEFPHNMTNTIFSDVVVNTLPNVGNINVVPNEPLINGTIGYTLVNYSLDAQDADGDILTLTWTFGPDTPVVVNTSIGGKATYTFNQTRNYTDPGTFNVTVVVTDGRAGHEVYVYKVVYVNSTNRPPKFVSFGAVALSGGAWALPNETIDFLLVLTDPEMDAIEVLIDWGDGSPVLWFNMTDYVGGNLSIYLNHSYSTIGVFTITMNYTDNELGVLNHSKSYTLTIETKIVIARVVEDWSWWDYTSLGLLSMIPVGAATWAFSVARRRRRLEEEGLTVEEWKLLKDESVQEALGQEKKN